jgi:hypothetical protein
MIKGIAEPTPTRPGGPNVEKPLPVEQTKPEDAPEEEAQPGPEESEELESGEEDSAEEEPSGDESSGGESSGDESDEEASKDEETEEEELPVQDEAPVLGAIPAIENNTPLAEVVQHPAGFLVSRRRLRRAL